jgi:hypothetical protein
MFGISKPVIASRNFDNEKILSDAIQMRRLVSFRYKDDLRCREFAPSALYYTPVGKVCASGEMTTNPNDLTDRPGPHNFEVGLMHALSITPKAFVPDPRFNRKDAKYRSGIICSV